MKRKTKKSPTTIAKDHAWDACSVYVRTRDAYNTCHGKTTWIEDKLGFTKEVLVGKCCTCNKEYRAFGQACAQAGHFVPGRNASTLFDERGIHLQCFNCNKTLKGNPRKYQSFMEVTYGQDLIDELDLLSDITVQYDINDYIRIRKYFEDLTDELIRNN